MASWHDTTYTVLLAILSELVPQGSKLSPYFMLWKYNLLEMGVWIGRLRLWKNRISYCNIEAKVHAYQWHHLGLIILCCFRKPVKFFNVMKNSWVVGPHEFLHCLYSM